MRRLIALSFLVAACGGASKGGPAWPKSAGSMKPDTWQEDGGQSIEPRVASDTAAVESSDEPLIDFSSLTIDILPDDTDAPAPPPETPDGAMVFTPEETIVIEGDSPPPPPEQP